MESLNNPNILDMQYPNLIDTKKFGDESSCGPMPAAGTDDDSDVAIRCRVITRLYGGGNSKRFAEDVLKIGYTRWNNMELTGALSRDAARIITRKFPEVSLDWLYRGTDNALTRQRGEELAAAFKIVAVEVRGPAKAKAAAGKARRAS